MKARFCAGAHMCVAAMKLTLIASLSMQDVTHDTAVLTECRTYGFIDTGTCTKLSPAKTQPKATVAGPVSQPDSAR